MPTHDDRNADADMSLDGALCPVCGQVVPSLPVVLQRVVGSFVERYLVCSDACRKVALRSPNVQTSLFDRDMSAWDGHVQGDLFSSGDGDGSGSGD